MAETIGKLINIEKRLIPTAKREAKKQGLAVKPYLEKIIEDKLKNKKGLEISQP